MVKLVRFLLREPANAYLTAHIGLFIMFAQRRMARQTLPQFIAGLRATGFPNVPRASSERVVRIRNAWLRQRWLQKCDTCYVRAMTLYRFLDAPGRSVRLHLGIETREHREERLHGHAWVSLDKQMLEGPPAVVEGRIREIPLPAVTG